MKFAAFWVQARLSSLNSLEMVLKRNESVNNAKQKYDWFSNQYCLIYDSAALKPKTVFEIFCKKKSQSQGLQKLFLELF